jgi:diadenosine tetraphosphate (Ap4A) HIT family hydrolase
MINDVNFQCPFCHCVDKSIWFENEWSFVIFDAFPISLGHSLIIPKRHGASFFEANEVEHLAFLQALQEAQQKLQQIYAPDGFNIGINDGLVAGQTVMHLHIHLIPRYLGDCVDPRGGVRWILPEKAVYWQYETDVVQ